MSTLVYEMNHGWLSVAWFYGVALAAYLAGLVRGRASWGLFLCSPFAVVLIALVDVGIYNVLAKWSS